VIGGFYWIQGEDDSVVTKLADAYKSNLTKFVKQLCIQLPISSATPIVLAKTFLPGVLFGSATAGSATVRAADDYIAAHQKHVYTVDTKDLARYDNGIHLTNLSELSLGAEMAKVAMP